MASVVVGTAGAGHEFPFYPSFYPQEITVEVVDPAAAARRLIDGSLHAYAGRDPFAGRPAPPTVGRVESLEAYVVVSPNPRASFFADRARRCAAAGAAAAALGGDRDGADVVYRAHAYPVTPYHGDYLQHADQARPRPAPAWPGPTLRLQPRGEIAERLVPAALRAPAEEWDVRVEAVPLGPLLAAHDLEGNGTAGPPWLRAGWFHAYLLQAPALADPAARREAEATYERLTGGEVADLVPHLRLERALVQGLQGGCERAVAGYTLRREALNGEYSGGVENVAHDAQRGLVAPAFVRTVKLKDFPWNGWLTVGVPAPATAAWNPLTGFTDPTGRLVWAALGDPALFAEPQGPGWVPNRVTPARLDAGAGRVPVPEEALHPEPGTGLLRRVAPGTTAATHLRYRVHASAFHDGTRMTVGDLLYPFVLAARWGAPGGPDHDPAIAARTALLRQRLVGLRVLHVETESLAFGEDKLTYEVPVIDVFLDHRAPEPAEAALVAPPWTALPWHLLALMEEAARQGLGALSPGEATRRGIPWIDLARDPALGARLARLVDELAARRHVPPALQGYAGPDEAGKRWAALRAFHDAHGHFLVTDGPYRLLRWTDRTAVLQVFRDLSYPRGVGAYDRLATPLRGFVAGVERQGDALVVTAEAERIERAGRDVRVVREAFVRRAWEQDKRSLPVCRFVVVGPDGTVEQAGSVEAADPGVFRVRPGGRAGTVLLALTVDDVGTLPAVTEVPWTP